MRLITTLIACLAFTPTFAQVTTPRIGSPERTAMMDALRIPIERDLKQRIQFKIESIRRQGNWAFLKGMPLRQDGKKIDYSKTRYAEAVKQGAFGYGVCALFKKTGKTWKVAKYVLGASDVPYTTWWKQFGAPKAIFDVTEGG